MEENKKKESWPFTILKFLIITGLIVCVFLLAFPPGGYPLMSYNEISAISALKTIHADEAIWCHTDWEGNNKNDYWTYDVSCLYRIASNGKKLDFASERSMYELVRSDSAAAADDVFGKGAIEAWSGLTTNSVAKNGYLIRAMERDEEGIPYNQVEFKGVKALNEFKFAFVAYPAEYGKTGRRTFIINELGTVYEIDPGNDKNKIILQWPGKDLLDRQAGPDQADSPVPGTKWEKVE